MNTPAIQKMKIVQELSLLPDHKLESVRTYIETILIEAKTTKNNRSLRGIWKDKGFEQLGDIEAAIKANRQQLSESILSRKL